MGIAYFLGGKAYDFLDEYFEKTRYEKIRKDMLKNLEGSVLDAGCGTGRNFPYYNPKAKVTGIDINSKMLKIARKRAKESRALIETKQMNLTKLNIPDNTFDAVVSTFVLCTMPKKYEQTALNELVRVTKPKSRLYFLEYIYSENSLRKFIMKATSFIPKLLYSIRFNSTYPLINKEKRLKIEKIKFVHDDVIRLIVARRL